MTTHTDSHVRSFGLRAVFHVPHAARVIPSDVREQFLVSDERLADEIRLMTDHFTSCTWPRRLPEWGCCRRRAP